MLTCLVSTLDLTKSQEDLGKLVIKVYEKRHSINRCVVRNAQYYIQTSYASLTMTVTVEIRVESDTFIRRCAQIHLWWYVGVRGW